MGHKHTKTGSQITLKGISDRRQHHTTVDIKKSLNTTETPANHRFLHHVTFVYLYDCCQDRTVYILPGFTATTPPPHPHPPVKGWNANGLRRLDNDQT